MPPLSAQRFAQVGLGILLLVIIRSLGEYFRLLYSNGEALAIPQATPYVAGALLAAIALVVALGCYFAALYRLSIAVASAAVALLFVYKVAVVG